MQRKKEHLDILSIPRKKFLKKKGYCTKLSIFQWEQESYGIPNLSGKFYLNTSVGYTGFQTRTPTYSLHFYRDKKRLPSQKVHPSQKATPASSKPQGSGKAQLTACRTICSCKISQSFRMEIPHPTPPTHSLSQDLTVLPVQKLIP